MFHISFNGIKNSLTLFKLIDISVPIDPKRKTLETLGVQKENNVETLVTYKKRKTTLGSRDIDLIEKINDDIIAYFFIEENKESSAWNLIAPVLLEKSTKKIYQYGLGYFAMEGCGGGLSNIDSICYYLKKHQEKGYQITLVPKIIDNKLLKSYEYLDSPTRLEDVISNSTDLMSYRKESFEWIYEQYQELLTKYELVNQ